MTRNDAQAKERRRKWRFPLQWEVRYRILRPKRPVEIGTGLTSNVSSRGIGFTSDQALPVGAMITLAMSWPATLADTCPLQLVATGRTVRSEGKLVACTIESFEFRTRALGCDPFMRPAGARAAVSRGDPVPA